jgi:glycosyltransferase involved in cell wall biosynthesis
MQNLKITLIEPHGHAEVLYSLISLFREFDLFVITTENCFNELLLLEVVEGLDIVIDDENCTVKDVVIRQFDKIGVSDWIVFVTIENNFDFYSNLKWNSKTVLVVHSGNFWFNFNNSIRIRSIVDFFRLLRAIVRRDDFYKRKLLDCVDFISFYSNLNNSNPKNYFFGIYHLSQKKKICPNFIYSYPNVIRIVDSKSKMKIVIPGSIRDNTREYEPVFLAFKAILKFIKVPVELFLLGNPVGRHGKRIQQKFLNLKTELFDVIVFPVALPKAKYDYWLSNADFLILPLRFDMYFGISKEIGGVTKIAGVINDMERFRIPSVISCEYNYTGIMSKYICCYENKSQLSKILLQWINIKTPMVEEVESVVDNKWRDFLLSTIKKQNER